jgi:hypothetical protein
VIPGVGGHLVSHAYLEEQVVPELAQSPIAAAFARQAARWWRGVTRSIGPAASARQVFDVAATPLLDALGYPVPVVYPVADMLAGVSAARDGQATLVITTPWATPVDAAWRDAVRGGVAADAAWALVTNGRSLRIVDCRRPWSKHVLRFDFGALLAHPRGAQLLWELAGPQATMSPAGPHALRARVDASNQHSANVCHSLSDGVLTALPQLAAALAPRGAARGRPFDEALTVVYRVLFLLFAEARGLVPMWHPVYREAYTIEALYQRSVDPRRPRGLWASLQAIARMAHAGCQAGDLDVTAFNGRLFSPRHARLVEQRRVPDEVVKALVLALTTTGPPTARRRIAYRDLGVEQLGSVYERVLEHEPAAARAGAVLRRTSTERKATGSFYTPRSITEFMVRRTLHPLVADRSAGEILALRVADPAMGSGAFLVAACHYLADQCEQALVRDGEWRAHDVTPAARAGLRRQVAEQCLYGVDLNPTAVQLARLSLWLTTLAAGRPLTFLDHHLSVGNSLVGGRLADLSRPPVRTGANQPRPLPLFDHDVSDMMAAQVLPERMRLAMQPSDSLLAVRDKERTLERLSAPDGPFATWSRAIDAWCAAALWPGAAPAPAVVQEWIASLLGRPTTLPVEQVRRWLAQAAAVAAGHAVFHWELAFPEVFFNAHGRPHDNGGFDAVLGNPPWDMLRADTGRAAARCAERDRVAPLHRFFRASGIYTGQGRGHANRYQLFLERALQLTRRGGRCGLILPSGIATDHGSAALRRQLFDRCAIDTWLGFDNRAGIFPIHRSVRFVLIAVTAAGRTEVLRLRSGLQDVHILDRYPSDPRHDPAEASLSISRSRLEAWDPEHLSVPELSSPAALAILATASAAPPLSADHGWRARFGRELNATDDRPHFIPRPSRGRSSALPVVEGKHVTPFQVAVAAATMAVPLATAGRLIDPVVSFARDRIAYRDVASATNRLTLIAGLLPRGALSTHTLFVLKTALAAEAQWCLLALLNSLVANYLVRLQVTTHVTTALMARLPVPRPPDGSPAFRELASLAREISRAGVDAAPDAFARLNAIVAALYQLTPEQYQHVVNSFPLLPEGLRRCCCDQYMLRTESQKHGNTV